VWWARASDITPGTVFEDPVPEHAADPDATESRPTGAEKELAGCFDRDDVKIGGFKIA
jgi:hypothetical protein